jgi:peptidoglycan hydrolase CwlO-like protein
VTAIPDEIKNLNLEKIDFNNKDGIKNLIILLLNTIDSLSQSVQNLQKENQELKDEINRLKPIFSRFPADHNLF